MFLDIHLICSQIYFIRVMRYRSSDAYRTVCIMKMEVFGNIKKIINMTRIDVSENRHLGTCTP